MKLSIGHVKQKHLTPLAIALEPCASRTTLPTLTARRRHRLSGIGVPTPPPTFHRHATEVKRHQLLFQSFVTSVTKDWKIVLRTVLY